MDVFTFILEQFWVAQAINKWGCLEAFWVNANGAKHPGFDTSRFSNPKNVSGEK